MTGSLDEDDYDIPEIGLVPCIDIDDYRLITLSCFVQFQFWLYFQIVKLIKIWFLTDNLLQFLYFLW